MTTNVTFPSRKRTSDWNRLPWELVKESHLISLEVGSSSPLSWSSSWFSNFFCKIHDVHFYSSGFESKPQELKETTQVIQGGFPRKRTSVKWRWRSETFSKTAWRIPLKYTRGLGGFKGCLHDAKEVTATWINNSYVTPTTSRKLISLEVKGIHSSRWR